MRDEPESAKMCLAVNEGKTKYMLTTDHSYSYTNNDVSLDIKSRVTLANRCYFGLNKQLSGPRDLSRATKLTLFKVLILPVLLYSAETLTISITDALGVF